ncbi:hypothetical protein, partial [Mesorhizobium sp. M5C.F.Ca.IN.020.32.2.1]|uniref:hypothetical protein n=1 Tax=Mesorhizobium sp. M5C.F.Ca.IN.020.32.2.1 TaxID=2496771 RepID=UPI0019D48E62
DKYWQKQKDLSLFIPRLEKKPTAHQNPSEFMLTALRRWISIFSSLEKKAFVHAFGPVGRAVRGAGGIS